MILDDVGSRLRGRHHAELLDSFTTFAVSFTILTTTSFLIIKLCQKLTQCCNNILRRRKQKTSKTKNSDNATPTKYRPLKRVSKPPPPIPASGVGGGGGSRRPSQAVPFSPLHTQEFQIPGMISAVPVQPILFETDGNSGGEDVRKMSACSEEYIQPDNLETRSLGRGMRVHKEKERYRHQRYSSAIELREDQLKPELYTSTVDLLETSLGKVTFSLQYEDNSKRKLNMVMRELAHLDLTKGPLEHVHSLLLSVTLLPEREYVYKSKTINANTYVVLKDKFSFHSRPRNRDFESRTIVVNIVCISENGKEVPYGEARLPLHTHEIYSQVSTDVTVGIKPVIQNEMGDAQIQMSYSVEQGQLTVICKTIHFSNISIFDKLAVINVKIQLLIPGGKKESKGKKISKTIRFNESRYIEFHDPLTFTLSEQQSEDCTVKMNIHGKTKMMGKKVCLGKIRIGANSSDDCGKVHWKNVMSAKDIAWVMWHPIYGGK